MMMIRVLIPDRGQLDVAPCQAPPLKIIVTPEQEEAEIRTRPNTPGFLPVFYVRITQVDRQTFRQSESL
jgi:hypothetical protein